MFDQAEQIVDLVPNIDLIIFDEFDFFIFGHLILILIFVPSNFMNFFESNFKSNFKSNVFFYKMSLSTL